MRLGRGRSLLIAGGLAVGVLAAFGAIKLWPFNALETGDQADIGRPRNPACSAATESDYPCYREHYRRVVRESGAEAALAELKAEYPRNQLVNAKCHELAHDIGRAAAKRYGGVPIAYSHGDDFCMGGFFHGVIETAVAQLGAENIRTRPAAVCADLGKRQGDPGHRSECAHVVGHGLMVALKYELLEALQSCDRFMNRRDQRECHSGVFMENAMSGRLHHDHSGQPSRYLDPDQPLYPCTLVATRYKERCYRYQTIYVLTTQNNDYSRAFNLCAEVANTFRPACYSGLGRDASAAGGARFAAATGHAKYTSMLCMTGPDHEARSNCIVGAARGIISWYRTDSQARMLCGFLSADLRAFCLREVSENYKLYTGESKRSGRGHRASS